MAHHAMDHPSTLEAALDAYNHAWHLNDEERHEEAVVAFGDLLRRFGEDPPEGRLDIPLDALYLQGRSLAALDRQAEAIAVFDAAVARFSGENDPALHLSVALCLLDKAYALRTIDKDDQAIAIYSDVVARFGGDTDTDVRERVAFALNEQGWLAEGDEALMAFEALAAFVTDDDEPQVLMHLGPGLYGTVTTLGELGRLEEAVASCDAALRRLDAIPDADFDNSIASILYSKGFHLSELLRPAEAVAALDLLVVRFEDADGEHLREMVGRALVAKVETLLTESHYPAVIAACEDLIGRLGEDADPVLRGYVARALNRRARAFGRLGRLNDAVSGYREVLVRFSAVEHAETREVVLDTMVDLAIALTGLGHQPEALVVVDGFLEQAAATPGYGDLTRDVWAWLTRAIALQQAERFEEAIEVYDEVIEHLDGIEDLELRTRRAVSLMNKAEALAMVGRDDEAEAANEQLAVVLETDVLEVFSKLEDELAGRQDAAARVQRTGLTLKKAMVLGSLDREDEANEVLEHLIESCREDEQPDVRRLVAIARELLDED